MKALLPILIILFALFIITGCGSTKAGRRGDTSGTNAVKEYIQVTAPGDSIADNKYLTKAVLAVKKEIEAAQIAQIKAKSSEVREFAKSIVKDLAIANKQLVEIAKANNMSIPVSVAHDKQLMELNNEKSDDEFDLKYMRFTHRDLINDIDFSEKASSKVETAALTAFFINHLPTLRGHLKTAESIINVLKENK